MVDGERARAANLASALGRDRRQMKADIDAEPAREARVRRDLIRRGRTPAPMLETWIGAAESDLVQAWGQPEQNSSDGTARFLTYVRGYERQTAMVQSGGGASGVVGEQTESHECVIHFEVRAGAVYDYRVEGDRHQCAVETFPRGPRPESG